MRILFLSFYYPPDLCAGSFRAAQLTRALRDQLPDGAHIDVITTQPNRYSSYRIDAPELEEFPELTVHRIKVSTHKSGMLDQAWAFMVYARQTVKLIRRTDYQLVFGTSSRLMTAALSAYVARKNDAPLYLDIRDIFVDTIRGLFPKRIAALPVFLFTLLERWTIGRASRINLVSEGFKGYFQSRYPTRKYSYFSHCIDTEVADAERIYIEDTSTRQHGPLTVLYAGNIGEGQGLHRVIPELAKKLEGRVVFRLIGDGGRKQLLEQRLVESDCRNVELLPPVKREQLLSEYYKADILLVHLNDYDAFRQVLPSKLYEYGSTGKPIWAGVSGYAASFIEKEISNAAIFKPCSVEEAVKVFPNLELSRTRREGFIEKFSCESVMKSMATDIIACESEARKKRQLNSGELTGKLLFFVTEDWYFCSHRLPLAVAARNAGFDVCVVTRVRDHGAEIRSCGLRLIPIELSRHGVNPFRDIALIGRLTRIYREESPDLVHHVALKPVLYGSLAAWLAGISQVVNAMAGLGFLFVSTKIQARLLRPIVKLAFRFLFNRSGTRLILQNPDDERHLADADILDAKQIRLIRGSGVDTRVFIDKPEPEDIPVVILASRMLWDKGVGEFVEAACKLKDIGVKARFVLVGDTDAGNPEAVSKEQLESWQNSGGVEWWGWREDMQEVFAQCNVFCLPSAYGEGVPKVLIEAASCGRAIVTSDWPGCREIVRNGVNGFLVPVRDADALANALRKLIENAELRQEMGVRGRKIVEAEFSIERVVEETLAVYRELL